VKELYSHVSKVLKLLTVVKPYHQGPSEPTHMPTVFNVRKQPRLEAEAINWNKTPQSGVGKLACFTSFFIVYCDSESRLF
jgi:hypothetical protein